MLKSRVAAMFPLPLLRNCWDVNARTCFSFGKFCSAMTRLGTLVTSKQLSPWTPFLRVHRKPITADPWPRGGGAFGGSSHQFFLLPKFCFKPKISPLIVFLPPKPPNLSTGLDPRPCVYQARHQASRNVRNAWPKCPLYGSSEKCPVPYLHCALFPSVAHFLTLCVSILANSAAASLYCYCAVSLSYCLKSKQSCLVWSCEQLCGSLQEGKCAFLCRKHAL